MKKINVKKSVLLLFLTLMIGILAACGGNSDKKNTSEEKEGEATSGGTLNIGLSANSKLLIPLNTLGFTNHR